MAQMLFGDFAFESASDSDFDQLDFTWDAGFKQIKLYNRKPIYQATDIPADQYTVSLSLIEPKKVRETLDRLKSILKSRRPRALMRGDTNLGQYILLKVSGNEQQIYENMQLTGKAKVRLTFGENSEGV